MLDPKSMEKLAQLKLELLAEEPNPELSVPIEIPDQVSEDDSQKEMQTSSIAKTAKKRKRNHKRRIVANWNLDEIYAAPQRPSFPNRAPNQKTIYSERPKTTVSRSENTVQAKQIEERHKITLSKNARKNAPLPKEENKHYGWFGIMHQGKTSENSRSSIHTYYGGMVRPK